MKLLLAWARRVAALGVALFAAGAILASKALGALLGFAGPWLPRHWTEALLGRTRRATEPQRARAGVSPTARPRAPLSDYTHTLALLVSGVVASVVVVGDPAIPGLVTLSGLWLCLGLPTVLLFDRLTLPRAGAVEALLISVATVILGLMLGGLALNQILRFVGIQHPFALAPLLVALDLALVGLALWRPTHRRALPRPRLSTRQALVLASSALIVLSAVAGAIRLNNGASGGVTVFMLALAAVVVIALMVWANDLGIDVISGAVYLISLALLLMTSLRGWYVTGHDVQQEFHVFQLTALNRSWDISRYQDPYNACLSITILPSIIGRITRIYDPYVFKVVFQCLFAVCPVIVFRVAARLIAPSAAVMAAVYFAAFPTYFTDMPFLNRQEIAFIFLGVGLLVLTNAEWSLQRRRIWFAVMAVGVVFSHYSTAYVLIGLMLMILIGGVLITAAQRIGQRVGMRRLAELRRAQYVICLPLLIGVLLLTALWMGPITGTSNGAVQTIKQTAQTLVTHGLFASRSSDVSYSLVGGGVETPAQQMAQYRAAALKLTAQLRAEGVAYPLSTVNAYPTPPVDLANLPLTAAGRALQTTGISATAVNTLLRTGFGRLLQIFVLLGLVGAVFGLLAWFRPSQELVLWAIASFVVVACTAVLPVVSEQYGLLRAVQQSLFVLAPFLVVGTMMPFIWLRQRGRTVLAGALSVTFLLSLTGVIPEALGGYPAQLNLENSGLYYEILTPTAEERSAVLWLDRTAAFRGGGTPVKLQTDEFTSTLEQFSPPPVAGDIFPPDLLRGALVLLPTPTVTHDIDAVSIAGNFVLYQYPLSLLDTTKNLIYSSRGARVYG
jgi:uncharacterized membrane protein